jgi:uncharacterized membrane protein
MAQTHPHAEHKHLPDQQPREKEFHHDTQQHSKLEKEFELERMVLFSDAVFAIAITLMVIDIKWPEIPESVKGVDLYKLFRTTIFQFIVFVISFFYIGRAWGQHLKLFRLLRTYDQGLINRNLRFLFFIVVFPFTASGPFGHVRSGFVLPLLLYMFNMMAVSVSQFMMIRYIFRKKPALSVPGEEAEKKYIYLRWKYMATIMASLFLLMILASLIFPDNADYVSYVFLLIPFCITYMNRKTLKYKPTTTAA